MGRLYHFFFDNLTTKLISVFVAIVLWIVVLSSRNVDISKEVPIEIVTSSDIVVGSEVPDHVVFQLSGPKAFRRAVEDRNETPIRINLNGVKPGVVSYSFSPEDIHLPLGMKVISVNPSNIRIKLEIVRLAIVKVRADLRGEPEKGYRITKSEVHPEEIQIRGSRAALSSLNELVSSPVNINGLNKNLHQPLNFDLSHMGIELGGPPPELTLEVEPISPNFRLRNVGIRVLSPHKVKLSEQSVTVFVRATADDLKSLDHSRVYAEIDLRGKNKGVYTSAVKVTTPRSISVIRVMPETVQVTLY